MTKKQLTNEQCEYLCRKVIAERDAMLADCASLRQLEDERLSMTVADVLRIVDANPTRRGIERALIANLPSNGGPPAWVPPSDEQCFGDLERVRRGE